MYAVIRSCASVMYCMSDGTTLTAVTMLVIWFPTVTDARKKPMTMDFILRGACVYENSRHVMETSTSAVVTMA